jgi:hypothetical protein
MNHTQNLRDQLVASHTLPSEETPPRRYWSQLGFDVDGDSYIVPELVVVIETTTDRKPRQIGVRPGLAINDGARKLYFYRVGDDFDFPTLDGWLGDDGGIYCPGQSIKLPTTDWSPPATAVKHHTALPILKDADIPARDGVPEATEPFENPLLKHSLRGKSEEFQNNAVESLPMLGDVCRKGQVTILYGQPNVGKTLVLFALLIAAVQEGRIKPERVLYVNADDNSEGMSKKMRILDDLGCHTIIPGFAGFKASNLISNLREMAEKDQAKDTLIIIDTIKKFTSIMDKKDSSNFADSCRQVAMRGGAVVGLAHTNKNPDANGKLRYAGTTDLIEDSDGAYMLSSVGEANTSERIVQFQRLKTRSDSPEQAAYAYSSEAGLSYEERVASVRPVDPDALHGFQVEAAQRNDAELIEATLACLAEGIVTKMALAKEVSNRLGVSQRDSVRLIERYTGTDPAFHRWNYTVASHGKHVFAALTDPAADPA